MTAILLVVIVALLLVIALLVVLLLTLRQANTVMMERTADHDNCVGMIMWHVKNDFARIVLLDAAREWDSVENIKRIERLRREWQPGAEGVVTFWLREQAERWKQAHP